MGYDEFDNTTYSNLIEEISKKVPEEVQIEALTSTFPNGVFNGKVFCIGSLKGEIGKSCKIDTASGFNFMKGKDFNRGDKIGGIVKILMEGRNMTLPQIKDFFAQYLDDNKYIQNIPSNPFKDLNKAKDLKKTKIKYDINTPFDYEHKYLDKDNKVLAIVRRYNLKDENNNLIVDVDGKPKKEFRQFIPDCSYPKLPEKRPLYNIPNILKSKKVIWVEGEKCADALNSVGFTATCHIGGAGMLTKNSEDKYDFSQLENKEVLVWGDNDTSGKKLADFVKELALKNGAKSVAILNPPPNKPQKWDAADAINDKNFNVKDFINDIKVKAQKSINLLDDSLLISRFSETAPRQKFLVENVMPLGVPALFSASGDSGKGMMTLDLAMKISSGNSLQSAFGGQISEFGNTIIFTAEDDEAEIHRRVTRLDPNNDRLKYQHKMQIIPLPNYGGVFPIMKQSSDKSYHTGEEFEKYYEQILQIDNLKLIVFDPLASFVHADVNADPAAGAALMGLMAKISTETGATVLLCHHMAKFKDNDPPKTPEEARQLIRGTSALVDGVRFAYSIWSVSVKEGKSRAKSLNMTYTRNGFFDGAVVKSNGPADRNIRKFVRDNETGLLNDFSDVFEDMDSDTEKQIRINALYDWIKKCENEGNALTQKASTNNILERLDDYDSPICLRGLKQSSINNYCRELTQSNKIAKFKITRSGPKIWLGVKGGLMDRGEYIPTTASDNV